MRILAILALLASFGPLATDTYLSAFPEMKLALRTGDAGVAASLSVFIFGLAAGQLLYGPLSDRFGRKVPLLVGTAVFTIASALASVAQSIEIFLVLRVLQSLGGCCGIIIGRAIVRDLQDGPELARAFSLLSMIGMAAPLVAPAIGLGFIYLAGWRAIFAALTMLGLICLAAVALGLPETLPPERRRQSLTPASVAGAFVDLLRRPRFLFASLTTGSAAGVLFSYITGSSAAFLGQFGLSKTVYSALFTGIVMAMIAGSQLNRRALARGAAQSRLVSRALFINLAAGAALPFAAMQGVVPLVAVMVVVVAMLGFVLPNSAAAAIEQARDHAGSAASLLGIIQFGSGFAASTAVALMQDGTAWPMLGGMMTSMALGAAAWAAQRRSCRVAQG